VISAMTIIRNALQTIASALHGAAKQMLLIQQSVNRIQWALNEILPGENTIPEFPATTAIAEKTLEPEPQTGTSAKS